ncbi:HD domain-containing protein [Phormidium sp. CLA17]|uniref:HD domain-containing protein n=1 Tax=Leptolyngbya sp. Cla-17 TaxID=2803751 RepID=UPI0014913CF2|nr:HD domain-containing protein [Leptolyngbya sp. Cla-17]MBM0740600.1 HD domain-containing protein [Leptolyngbya sp. Cla-17]
MLPNSGRTYQDPLHGAIALDGNDPIEALIVQLIDTPAFQRLRRIRQLGPASLTFHGAESSRFTHSIGVMAIARRAFDRIAKSYPQLQPYRPVVLCGALLHDIGHGPFSHTAEEIFGCHHEQWTERILQESSIRQALTAFSPKLLEQLLQVYRHTHPVPLVWQLVSSQLDCDRLDYLMRDSYFTGASYGKIDLDRILMALGYDPVSQQLVVARKGMAAVEHYLIVRYFMYAQVYNHPKNIAATWILEQAFNRARSLLSTGDLTADDTVTAWLTGDCDRISLTAYLAADDGVFTYHLQRWQQHTDAVLSDLCRRFCDRDLFKGLDITHLDQVQRETLFSKTQYWLTQAGFDAPYYSGIRISFSRGYTLYQKGIKIQTPTELQEISNLSPLVQTLTQPYERAWLIYPKEIESMLSFEF